MKYFSILNYNYIFNKNSSVYSFLRYRQVLLFGYLIFILVFLYVYTFYFYIYIACGFFGVEYTVGYTTSGSMNYLRNFCELFVASSFNSLYVYDYSFIPSWLTLNTNFELSRYNINYKGVSWFEECSLCGGRSSIPITTKVDFFKHYPIGMTLPTMYSDTGVYNIMFYYNNLNYINFMDPQCYTSVLELYSRTVWFLEAILNLFGFFDQSLNDFISWKDGYIFSIADISDYKCDMPLYGHTFLGLNDMWGSTNFYNIFEIVKASSNLNLDLFSAYYTTIVDIEYVPYTTTSYRDLMSIQEIKLYTDIPINGEYITMQRIKFYPEVFLQNNYINTLVYPICTDILNVCNSFSIFYDWVIPRFFLQPLVFMELSISNEAKKAFKESSFYTNRYHGGILKYLDFCFDKYTYIVGHMVNKFSTLEDVFFGYYSYSYGFQYDNIYIWGDDIYNLNKYMDRWSSLHDRIFGNFPGRSDHFFLAMEYASLYRDYIAGGYFGLYSNFLNSVTIDDYYDYSPWNGYWEGINLVKSGLSNLLAYTSIDYAYIFNTYASYSFLYPYVNLYTWTNYKVDIVNDICLAYFNNCYSNLDLYYHDSMNVHSRGYKRIFSSIMPEPFMQMRGVYSFFSIFAYELDVTINTLFKEYYIDSIQDEITPCHYLNHPLFICKYGIGFHNTWATNLYSLAPFSKSIMTQDVYLPMRVLEFIVKVLCCIYPLCFVCIIIILSMHILYAYDFLLNDYVECMQFRLFFSKLLLVCLGIYSYLVLFDLFLVDLFIIDEYACRNVIPYNSTDTYNDFNQNLQFDEIFLKLFIKIYYLNTYSLDLNDIVYTLSYSFIKKLFAVCFMVYMIYILYPITLSDILLTLLLFVLFFVCLVLCYVVYYRYTDSFLF